MKTYILQIAIAIFLLYTCSPHKMVAQSSTINSAIKATDNNTIGNKAKLDSLFNVLEANNKFMGTVTVSEDGQIIYTKSVGYDDVETLKKSTANSRYRIGSISKMFTASMVFMSIENGSITLEEKIDTYFPDVVNSDKITVANLLNHRSGIFNFTNDDAYMTYNTEYKSEDDIMKMISNYESVFEPGSKSSYSNSNYYLLSIILEKIENKSYAEILEEKITVPYNLKNTFFGDKINLDNNEVHSYAYSSQWDKSTETDMSIPLGAGSIVSTPSDLTRFIELLFNGDIISQESIDKITSMEDNYGMGIFRSQYNDKISYGHTGGIDGFSSALSFFPENKLSIALCSNGNQYNNNDILLSILRAYYGDPFAVPSFVKVDISEEDLKQYLGNYSTDVMPLKIEITIQDGVLIAQGTGQPKFPLEYKGNDLFSADAVAAELEFNIDLEIFILKQGGREITFTKEK